MPLGLIGIAIEKRRTPHKKCLGYLALSLLLATLMLLLACGGAASAGSGSDRQFRTPPGTYNITVVGKDGNSLSPTEPAPVISVTVN